MTDFNYVYYLEDSDFEGNKLVGFQRNPMFQNKPVICMAFADWCGYCKIAKPEYQKVANKIEEMKNKQGDVPFYVACIKADGGSEGEQKLAKRLKDILPGFRGFPHILKFEDGKASAGFEGQRTMEGFMNFM